MVVLESAPPRASADAPQTRAAQIMEIVERILAEQQRLVLRREELTGRDDPAAVRERASLDAHMAAHGVSLDRLLAELGMLEPPAERPPTGD